MAHDLDIRQVPKVAITLEEYMRVGGMALLEPSKSGAEWRIEDMPRPTQNDYGREPVSGLEEGTPDQLFDELY